MTEGFFRDAAATTPDPDRAYRNLLSFHEQNPAYEGLLSSFIKPVSLLFSISQFLAQFSASHPDSLLHALKHLDTPLDKDLLLASLREAVTASPQPTRGMLMESLRIFKRKMLLLITLRDITGRADIVENMSELSILADVIVEASLGIISAEMKELYGTPEEDAFSIIAVGKLGSDELNFSSDIDLLYVYGREEGETSGVMTSRGIVKNRISNHEFYCKLGEALNRFLTVSTENGFLYRVDLRLRPEGQKGSLAISLPAYEIYYESWGRAWERAVLLRARPVAGDPVLGREFIEMVRPFVYRKYLDFNAIDEIRRMKMKIDEKFKKDDIKRGQGGIREIEFFGHALQLLYGGKEPLIRERSTIRALYHLYRKNFIGSTDYALLSENYRFLRKLEHRLQQLNDLQTHTLPSSETELTALAKKMGFPDKPAFVSALADRRKTVRLIHDSLFREHEQTTSPVDDKAALLLSEELSENEAREFLAEYGISDTQKAARDILHIRESASLFQTLRGQRLLAEVLPAFLIEALMSRNPDAALTGLQSFVPMLTSEEAYLELFSKNKSLIPVLTRIFSESDYLLKTIMKRLEYMEILGHDMYLKNTVASLRNELGATITSDTPLADAIRIQRQSEEIRLGTLFLSKGIDVLSLIRGLSRAAEAILSVCTQELIHNGFIVIGMGKLGGREITFDSDLDIIFASDAGITDLQVKAAERLIRLLSSYTKDGIAYRVDTRLRPDGTKGPLVSSFETLQQYYSGAAHFWELQALLKARPLAGDRSTSFGFMSLRNELLRDKGRGVSAGDIKAMREKIQRELSREREGFDIKLGPGGIEELEFTVQYLQLLHAGTYRSVLVQGTLDAVRRLSHVKAIGKEEALSMRDAYLFYRTLESFLRLRGENLLRRDDIHSNAAAEFMGLKGSEQLFSRLEEKRGQVKTLFAKYLC